MSELVVAAHQFDLPIAGNLVSQNGGHMLVVDPLLQNHALSQGHPPLLYQAGLSGRAYLESYKRAEVASLQMSRALAPVLNDLTPAAGAAAWSSHRTLQMFLTLFCYQEIWKNVVPAYATSNWHVLLPSSAHDYGIHSFLPGLTLIDALQASSSKYMAYGYECPSADNFLLPDLRQLPPDIDLLCHVPTCFQDAQHLSQELHASQMRCGVLTSQRYDVPLAGHDSTGLVDLATVRAELSPQCLSRLAGMEAPIKAVLLEHLRPHIFQGSFLLKQIDALWEVLSLQCLFFSWLEQRLSSKPPRCLLISNHDATVHGSLMSFAQSHGMKILIVPHSRVHNSLIKTDGLAPTCLHHGMQDGPVLDLAERVIPSRRLRYPGEWKAPVESPDGVRKLGVILSGISGNGVCVVDFDQYVDGIRKIREWAAARGIQFKLRVRAAETPLAMLADRLQMDAQELLMQAQGSLLDFARNCDLCLGYDSPTSGLQDLIREGIPAMQIDRRPLSRLEWSIVDATIVPRYELTEGLERLGFMHQNPAEFRSFSQKQHQAGLKSQGDAQPLRHWLQMP